MNLSVVDIAKNISWTDNKKIYLVPKNSKYELLVEYLNSGTVEDLERDIEHLKKFHDILLTENKEEIEKYIMTELEGFSEFEDGYFAHIAGAHDLSPSIQYNIQKDSITLRHPNLPSIERMQISPEVLISLLNQMKKIIQLIKET